MEHLPAQHVVVLDFGAQYSQLIARRIRECRVYCELLPFGTPLGELRARRPAGIVLSGGPPSVYGDGAPSVDPAIYDLGIPVLGICYGMQLMAQQLGGQVTPAARREFGRAELEQVGAGPLFTGLAERFPCWMSHGDRVDAPPPGFAILARTHSSPVAAMADDRRGLYGVQFHPEVSHTPGGIEILRNFLYRVCRCRGDWTITNCLEAAVADVRSRVANDRVVCALSGGVDSTVAAALVHRAIGDQLHCVFVNHGFLRAGEPEAVRTAFQHQFRAPLVYVDAADRFLARLAGVIDPEEKRKRIGEEFIRVFEEEARRLGSIRYLVQGTLYPDVIESGPGAAATIKTHHNVGGLPEVMDLDLIEPLRWLFKDEVRALGEALGVPESIIWRHPFPGPGLAIRIIGEVDHERLETLRAADTILLQELREAGLYRSLAQAFAVLVPIRSVGVMGDQRTYAHPIVIRAVTSEDFMTADWARLPDEVLERISRRIVNEVPGINRVLYDVTSKPPATIEWE
jgi:GMP synthase (glutamine-hydrolysing)